MTEYVVHSSGVGKNKSNWIPGMQIPSAVIVSKAAFRSPDIINSYHQAMRELSANHESQNKK